MFELFVLGCTGVVVFIHGANFFFRALSRRLTARPLSFLGAKHILFHLPRIRPALLARSCGLQPSVVVGG
ncbi:hypothetical protein OPV22_018380 [Ensete ventricosum]|uniref:Uncharacterized protein n=1 Tax=Ensete ventricosum TaxID=4639 RepID=A0AAV8R1U3_ENSVE|nr:hypothetical protein OPV22_018380 [Ensete ventricosum]